MAYRNRFSINTLKLKRPAYFRRVVLDCLGEDLNLHLLRDTALNRARLPIPPPRHFYVTQIIICQTFFVSILLRHINFLYNSIR